MHREGYDLTSQPFEDLASLLTRWAVCPTRTYLCWSKLFPWALGQLLSRLDWHPSGYTRRRSDDTLICKKWAIAWITRPISQGGLSFGHHALTSCLICIDSNRWFQTRQLDWLRRQNYFIANRQNAVSFLFSSSFQSLEGKYVTQCCIMFLENCLPPIWVSEMRMTTMSWKVILVRKTWITCKVN